MPVQYEGIIAEHMAVRKHAGIFDVSHMGKIDVIGPEAEKLLDYLSTNKIEGKKQGTATYTVWCRADGGTVDDLIIYKLAEEQFFIVVNAGNREKDLTHLLTVAKEFNVKIEPRFEQTILAVQGPKALEILSKIYPGIETLKPMKIATFGNVVISGTGYTGSGGVEIFASEKDGGRIWDQCIALGVISIGLGARDTLRLEKGFALYGHELSDEISPIESVSAWTVKLNKPDFLGKNAIKALEEGSKKRQQYGVILRERGVARAGCRVLDTSGKSIGVVTSGTHSPSLKKAIAIVLVSKQLQEGDTILIEIRNKQCKAEVTALPFV